MSERGARALELAVEALKRIEAFAPAGSKEAERASDDRDWRLHMRHLQTMARITLGEISRLGNEAGAEPADDAPADDAPKGGAP
jgi:hypothetical protein